MPDALQRRAGCAHQLLGDALAQSVLAQLLLERLNVASHLWQSRRQLGQFNGLGTLDSSR
eukprot:scaffold42680_cov67-Phaeocystis_antarctica.AAC.10